MSAPITSITAPPRREPGVSSASSPSLDLMLRSNPLPPSHEGPVAADEACLASTAFVSFSLGPEPVGLGEPEPVGLVFLVVHRLYRPAGYETFLRPPGSWYCRGVSATRSVFAWCARARFLVGPGAPR